MRKKCDGCPNRHLCGGAFDEIPWCFNCERCAGKKTCNQKCRAVSYNTKDCHFEPREGGLNE